MTKPGIKTSEFWLVIAVQVIGILLAVLDVLDAQWAVAVSGVLTAVYAALRTYAKKTDAEIPDEPEEVPEETT